MKRGFFNRMMDCREYRYYSLPASLQLRYAFRMRTLRPFSTTGLIWKDWDWTETKKPHGWALKLAWAFPLHARAMVWLPQEIRSSNVDVTFEWKSEWHHRAMWVTLTVTWQVSQFSLSPYWDWAEAHRPVAPPR